MNADINHILVVGGGTAGWLSAAILAKQLNSIDKNAVQVTLVESPDIPIIGVGEGTWPTMRTTLQQLGIDEGEFMRSCDATFKQGSQFVDWAKTPTAQEHCSYYHPLSAVFHSSYDFNLAPYWILGDAGGQSYDKAVATQSYVCDAGKAPKKITTPGYEAIQNYSYHLNANKFAEFLAIHSVEKLGVKRIKANVTKVTLDDDGFVCSVATDSEGDLAADFFVDCTGSRALVLGNALQIPWLKIDHILFNDTALAMQVPYETADHPIATHTIATAQEAGWTWDIGLHNRRGVGYVYSSNYTTDKRAEQVLRDYVGSSAQGLEVRKIPLNLGYREKFWHKNCVAIGMSAAFIEPLEASAIFLIEAAANMLADQFPRFKSAIPFVEEKYNTTFRLRWDKSVDFVKLHYCITKRQDTAYWVDNCNPETIPLALKKRLAHWQNHPPTKYDFDYAYEPFVLDSYLFVLYGMNFSADIAHNRTSFTRNKDAIKKFNNVKAVGEMLVNELPSHRELIEKVYRYGVPKI